MTVRERIGAIRLIERIDRQSEYAKHIGVVGKLKIERIDQNATIVKEK